MKWLTKGGPKLREFFYEIDHRLGAMPVEQLFAVSQYNGVVAKELIDSASDGAQSFEKYKVVESGDLVLNRFNAYRGALGVAPYRGLVSPDYTVLRPKLMSDSVFFNYWLRSSEISNAMKATMGGLGASDPDSSGFSRISIGDLMNLRVQIDSREARQHLAEFLDQQTSQIDLLISKKEQLIEKLLERRQALVTQLVALGLDSSVPTKESGIEWAPAVPEKWPIKKLKYAFRAIKGGVWGEDARGDELDIWCVRIADFDRRNFSIRTDSKTFRNVKLSERHGRILTQGDIVLEKSGGGEKAPVGFAAIYEHPEDAVCSNFTNIVTVDSGNFPKYWVYMLSAVYQSGAPWRSIKQTSGIQNLDISSYFDVQVPFPPLSLQIEIAESINQGTEKIDLLIDSTIRAIELLKERRKSLITQVVTGKIDVRGFAGGNP